MHLVDERNVQLLSSVLSAADLELRDEQIEQLASHLEMVLLANDAARLTAIESFEAGARLHVLDSLLALPEVLSALDGRILDMGTGGGYPGIPLAICTGRPVDLVDSVGKKARLVQGFLESDVLGMTESRAIASRLEKATEFMPARGYPLVVARALSSLPSLCELASPVLAEGGSLVAMKGDLTEEELGRGDEAAKIVGLLRRSVRRYALPGGGEKRAVVVFEKVGRPRIALPRREGLAQRKPLA